MFIQSKNKFTDLETYLRDERNININTTFDNFNGVREEIRREDEDFSIIEGALEVELTGKKYVYLFFFLSIFRSFCGRIKS